METTSHLKLQNRGFQPNLDTSIEMKSSHRVYYVEDPSAISLDISFTRLEKSVLQKAIAELGNLKGDDGENRSKDEVDLVEAIEIAVRAKREDLASIFLTHLKEELPLRVIHRAGENELMEFLKTALVSRTPIKNSGSLRNIPLKMLPAHRRKSTRMPLFSNARLLTTTDLLRWACLSQNPATVRQVLNFDLQFDSKVIVTQLIHEGFEELLISLVAEGKVELDRLVLLTLLEFRCMRTLMRLSAKWISMFTSETPKLLASKKVLWKLISLTEDVHTVVESFFLLSFVQPEDFDKITIERLYDTLNSYINCRTLEESVLVHHWNPILLCVVASEICDRVSKCSLTYRDRFETMGDTLRNLAALIQEQYTDYNDLKELYTEVLFGNQCLFDIVVSKPDKYRQLLMRNQVVSAAEDLWRGTLRAGLGIQGCIAALSYFNGYKNLADLWKVHRTFEAKMRLPSFFQFTSWKRDGFIRYVLETVCLISVYVLMVIMLMQYLRDSEEDIKKDSGLNNEDAFIIFYTVTLVIYHLQILALKLFLGQKPNFDVRLGLDVGLCLLAVQIEDLQTGGVLLNLDDETSVYMLELLSGLLYLLAGFRISIVLLRTRTFGPILRMIYIICKDISSYLFIYALTILSFSMLFASTLWRIPSFSSIPSTIRTLFHWGISGLDLGQLTSKPELASVLGIGWTLISAVFMLNLLIAVLSARYEALVPQAKADFACLVYMSYNQTRCDSEYGSIVIAPAPFNILTLPAIPLYFFYPKKAARINHFFTVLSYQVLFITAALVFLLQELAVSPLIYIYVFMLTCKQITFRKTLWAVIWLLAGPFYLIFLCGVSFKHLWVYLYFEAEDDSEHDFDYIEDVHQMLNRITFKSKDDVVISLETLGATLKPFPSSSPMEYLRSSQSVSSKSTPAAGLLVKSYFNIQWKKTVKLLERFSSVKELDYGFGQQMINVTRARDIFEQLKSTPRRLTAVSIWYTQKALIKARIDS